ncbi:hypothetical protein VIF_002108 [Vibrio cholerae TM 11079-80]|nr:hypothetical protein VIF_002108 [Vibrio cholerae TM 11079-80]
MAQSLQVQTESINTGLQQVDNDRNAHLNVRS